MAELLAEVDGSEAYHADWRELLAILVARGIRVDLLWLDTPYSLRTHGGHDEGSATANRAKDWADGKDVGPGDPAWMASQIRRAAAGKGERRRINYAAWTPRDVREFVAAWTPQCDGWIVTITDHVLAPHWSKALERAGRYVFAPIPYVAPGSRVRMLGDGPPLWANWMIFARPRGGGFEKWGTGKARAARGDAPTLPGAYVLPPGEGGAGKLDVVGGKPDWLHGQIIEQYSTRGGLVVDPTAGGGGAGREAIRRGRRAILGDALREHADLCAAALREGAALRDAARAYLPPPPRAEQIALPLRGEP